MPGRRRMRAGVPKGRRRTDDNGNGVAPRQAKAASGCRIKVLIRRCRRRRNYIRAIRENPPVLQSLGEGGWQKAGAVRFKSVM